jgi:hypothetical protein
MKNFAFLAIALALVSSAFAQVVRPAPEFIWEGINGVPKTLSGLQKQTAVLIIATSPKSGAFKDQLEELERLYRQYAGREALFFAAFTQKPGIVKSDIPFLYVQNPQAVAASYGARRFQFVIIGPDRNMDLVTDDVTSGERVRDVIDNSYSRQAMRRNRP